MLPRAGTILFLTLIVASPASSWGQASLDYQFDLRSPVDGSDKLGVDFDVHLDALRESPSFTGFTYSLKANARGFQDFSDQVSQLDNMQASVALGGQFFAAGLSEGEQKRRAELLARFMELDEAERQELQRLADRVNERRWFVDFGFGYTFETSQDLNTRQHAVGGVASAELPFVHNALGLITQAWGESNPQPLRAFAGLEYVSGLHEVLVPGGEMDEPYPRLRMEAAWSTRPLPNVKVRALWIANYLMDAPDPIDQADLEFTNQIQVWLIYPISASAGILVKYVDGRLPPNLRQDTVAKLGFTITPGLREAE